LPKELAAGETDQFLKGLSLNLLIAEDSQSGNSDQGREDPKNILLILKEIKHDGMVHYVSKNGIELSVTAIDLQKGEFLLCLRLNCQQSKE
jgi:hypothetical protein